MPNKADPGMDESLGSNEAGVLLSWRNPARIWTLGKRYQLRGGAIVFELEGPRNAHRVVPGFRTLTEFVRLADATTTDEEVLRYARTWGVLGLCPHGLPGTHEPHHVPFSLGLGLWLEDEYCCRSGVNEPEPVRWWRYWAGQAAALVTLIAALRTDKPGRRVDWEALWTPGPWITEDVAHRLADVVADARRDYDGSVIGQVGAERDLCANALAAWLRIGKVQPRVRFWDRPSIEVRNSGLFDSLGLLLTFIGGDVEGFALCHTCGTPLIPGRRLGPRQHAYYCEACRKEGRPARDAKRAYYRRKATDPVFRESEAARTRRRRAAPEGRSSV